MQRKKIVNETAEESRIDEDGVYSTLCCSPAGGHRCEPKRVASVCDGCRRRSRRRHRQCLPRVGIGACTQGDDTSSRASALPWRSGSERTTPHGDRRPPGEEGACVFPAVDEESPVPRQGPRHIECFVLAVHILGAPVHGLCGRPNLATPPRADSLQSCRRSQVLKPSQSSLSLFSLFAADNAKNW